ncbi:hypothetical protein ACVW05_004573, partial [Pseudomonas fulva]
QGSRRGTCGWITSLIDDISLLMSSHTNCLIHLLMRNQK